MGFFFAFELPADAAVSPKICWWSLPLKYPAEI
jgi:hypothetical protein